MLHKNYPSSFPIYDLLLSLSSKSVISTPLFIFIYESNTLISLHFRYVSSPLLKCPDGHLKFLDDHWSRCWCSSRLSSSWVWNIPSLSSDISLMKATEPCSVILPSGFPEYGKCSSVDGITMICRVISGRYRLLLISNSRNSPFWKFCLMTLTSS